MTSIDPSLARRSSTSRGEPGNLWLLRDADGDGDGKAEVKRALVGKKDLHGIAFDGQSAYLVAIHEAFAAPLQPDASLGPLRTIATGIPDGGQHPNRTIAVGRDGKLYLSVGVVYRVSAERSSGAARVPRPAPE